VWEDIVTNSSDPQEVHERIVALHVAFGLAQRDDAWPWVIDAWEAEIPRAIALTVRCTRQVVCVPKSGITLVMTCF